MMQEEDRILSEEIRIGIKKLRDYYEGEHTHPMPYQVRKAIEIIEIAAEEVQEYERQLNLIAN